MGGQSSRPGAERVGTSEEWRRLEPALDAIRTALPDVPISIDTFHAEVARKALDAGADMINDISAGALDPELPMVVAEPGSPIPSCTCRARPARCRTIPCTVVVHEVKHHLEERCVQLKGAWD